MNSFFPAVDKVKPDQPVWPKGVEDCERLFRDKFSTYVWVMDSLLERAGFTIKSKQMEDGVLGIYICTKN